MFHKSLFRSHFATFKIGQNLKYIFSIFLCLLLAYHIEITCCNMICVNRRPIRQQHILVYFLVTTLAKIVANLITDVIYIYISLFSNFSKLLYLQTRTIGTSCYPALYPATVVVPRASVCWLQSSSSGFVSSASGRALATCAHVQRGHAPLCGMCILTKIIGPKFKAPQWRSQPKVKPRRGLTGRASDAHVAT